MGEIIGLTGINKTYGEGDLATQVLFDINLYFNKGTFNSIIGQSGSGKSTLLNIMGTLDRPTSGKVQIAGTMTDGLNRNTIAELRNGTIGFVFQFHYLLPDFTALENVLMPYLIFKGKSDKNAAARADELLELVGLSNVKNNLATKMSGGQQQRTAIARSLMNNPKIVLADEPTGNLDSDSTENIYKIFRQINEKYGTTFVVITHNRKIAELTDRIIEIKDGRISLDLKK